MDYSTHFPNDIARALKKHRSAAEKALAQLDDPQFFEPLGDTSPAVLVKHMAGSTRSRFTDFLTTDGEKADRQRDREFDTSNDSRDELMAAWGAAWNLMIDVVEGLDTGDLAKTVTIRGEPHSVPEALLRALTHGAYHTGQIVQLAKYRRGDAWQTLSIPKGASEVFTADMRRRFSDTSS